jgi:flagellar biosynthesis chaperone FliJ
MSTRETRIARVVELRDQRLKLAVLALEEARAVHNKAQHDFSASQSARLDAERTRRELSKTGTDIRSFIDAEEWLRSRALQEELCGHRLWQAKSSFEKGQQRVKEAAIKLRQLQQLQERLRQTRRSKENRAERSVEDEIGQRAAQSERSRKREP